jgi:hypothetical protein
MAILDVHNNRAKSLSSIKKDDDLSSFKCLIVQKQLFVKYSEQIMVGGILNDINRVLDSGHNWNKLYDFQSLANYKQK